jgi:tryptophan 2,3-dioxygenase
VLLADELRQRGRPQPHRERRVRNRTLLGRVCEQVGHVGKYAQRMSRQEQTGLADEFAPVLPGRGASDYERYLRTDELLSLQKAPEERAHHDELLFQTTHQASELWLKLAGEEMEVAAGQLGHGEIRPALRLLGRVVLGFKLATHALDMLELMSPREYTAEVRPVLGHGSGFDSPGWNRVRHAAPALLQAFDELRRKEGLSLLEVYTQGRDREDLYQLAEALTDLDEWATTWRVRHFMVVERIIGGEVVGTQGTPVEMLAKLVQRKLYPELWKVRTELTNRAIGESD